MDPNYARVSFQSALSSFLPAEISVFAPECGMYERETGDILARLSSWFNVRFVEFRYIEIVSSLPSSFAVYLHEECLQNAIIPPCMFYFIIFPIFLPLSLTKISTLM
mmetsp:Transcript_27428/g.54926  ORF Transcript_27428/g.54926 Transcript_27428/m.54926 type:complete len:107 (+) Transcript_27428:2-322(+)